MAVAVAVEEPAPVALVADAEAAEDWPEPVAATLMDSGAKRHG